ncbi:MAG: TonB-dependent receptor [Sphingomonas taxi]
MRTNGLGDARRAMMAGSAIAAAMLWTALPAAAQQADPAATVPSAQSAPAAEADADPADRPATDGPDVVVTGSRIVRNGYSAPTPVTVATTTDLQLATPTNLSDGLNKLPQFQGSISPKSNSQLFANSGEHGNLLNLRGVGANRVLILLDGVRVPPTTYRGAVDSNIIPQLLVQRVDVVTAGASAAYGSDAVSGVVNYVLDGKFTGLRGVAQSGVSDRGDLGNYRLGLAGGLSFAGGRGHLLASYERFDSKGITRDARGYGGGRYAAVGRTAGAGTAGTAANPLVFISGGAATVQTFGGVISGGPLAGTVFLPDGTTRSLVAGTATGTPGINIGGDGFYLGDNNQLIAPLTTDQAFGRFTYELADNVTAYVQGSYSRSKTSYDTQANNILGGRIYSGNPFLPASVQSRLTATATDSFALFQYLQDSGPFHTEDTTDAYLVGGGLKGTLGGGWKWNVDYLHGRAKTTVAQSNQFEVPKLYAALDAVRDTSGNIVCRVTITNPGLYPGCVPINVFGGRPSAAALAYVTGTSRYEAVNVSDNVMAGISGDLFALPAGPVSIAIGGEYRKQKLDLTSNADPSVAVDFTGIRGNPVRTRFVSLNVGSAHGDVSVKEAFGELAIPILKDTPFFRALDLNGAVRFTDYSTSGHVTTWKGGATWKPVDDLTLRVTRSRDIRAPALFDLFAGQQSTSSTILDPVTNTSGTVFQQPGGNVNLNPERADTLTFGAVVQPRFIPGFSVSIDYYRLTIRDAIVTPTGNEILTECFNSGSTSPVCSAITRPTPTSFPTSIALIPQNLALLETAGIDVDATYRREIAGGTFNARVYANFVDKFVQQTSSTQPRIDYAGYGVNGTVNYARPKFKAAVSLGYEKDGFNLFVQENIIGRVKIGPLQVYDVPAIKPVAYTDLTIAQSIKASGGDAQFFLTVTNLFDKQPPLVPNAGVPGLYYPTLFSLYDIAGRTYTAGVRFRF